MDTTTLSLLIDGGDGLQASTTRVRDLIDTARSRHWSFANTLVSNGAAARFLEDRQRTHLAAHGAAIEGLVNSSYEQAMGLDGARLVALLDGVGTFTDTYEDGWAVHLEDGIVPYIDPTEPRIAGDPFGTNGGTPGFPMPTDMVRLSSVHAVYSPSGRVLPIAIIPERDRAERPGRDLTAFLSGNRLVPNTLFSGTIDPRWQQVTAIQVSYVGIQSFLTLDDVVMLPSVLCGALTADLALFFARQSKDCPAPDKAGFERDAQAAAAAVAMAGIDMVESVTSSHVIRRR